MVSPWRSAKARKALTCAEFPVAKLSAKAWLREAALDDKAARRASAEQGVMDTTRRKSQRTSTAYLRFKAGLWSAEGKLAKASQKKTSCRAHCNVPEYVHGDLSASCLVVLYATGRSDIGTALSRVEQETTVEVASASWVESLRTHIVRRPQFVG